MKMMLKRLVSFFVHLMFTKLKRILRMRWFSTRRLKLFLSKFFVSTAFVCAMAILTVRNIKLMLDSVEFAADSQFQVEDILIPRFGWGFHSLNAKFAKEEKEWMTLCEPASLVDRCKGKEKEKKKKKKDKEEKKDDKKLLPPPRLVIVVFSEWAHYSSRVAIRESYKKACKEDCAVLFVSWHTDDKPEHDSMIQFSDHPPNIMYEAYMHSDMLVLHTLNHRILNESRKMVQTQHAAFKWIRKECKRVACIAVAQESQLLVPHNIVKLCNTRNESSVILLPFGTPNYSANSTNNTAIASNNTVIMGNSSSVNLTSHMNVTLLDTTFIVSNMTHAMDKLLKIAESIDPAALETFKSPVHFWSDVLPALQKGKAKRVEQEIVDNALIDFQLDGTDPEQVCTGIVSSRALNRDEMVNNWLFVKHIVKTCDKELIDLL